MGAFISLTHGEGFGLPLLEASACELPVVATNWSGQLDFLKRGKFSAIDYDMKQLPEAAVWENVLVKDSRWAEVKEEDVKRRMKKMSSSTSIPRGWAKELAQSIKEEFDLSVVQQQFVDVVGMLLKEKSAVIDPLEYLKSLVDTPENYNVVYTMPMSTGDVFISTAVIDGLVKQLPTDHKIYFATDPKYFDVLKGNPHIYKTIPWNQNMINVEYLEEAFDLALTPNVATQYTFSNWVRRGQGRLLAEEFANHCQSELGDYHIELDDLCLKNFKLNSGYRHEEKYDDGMAYDVPVYRYMTFHPGSGTGQWEARKYVDWKEVLLNLKKLCPDIKVVQVGSADEPKFDEVDIDLRGKTSVHQLASVVKNSLMHLSIDTFTMHLASAFDVPLVALFGSSNAKSTGPWTKNKETSKQILLEAETKMGCQKACYKYTCKVNKDLPCVNEIDPYEVFQACAHILNGYTV
jgi:ADP-heptose:LPS heptosyltransferase